MSLKNEKKNTLLQESALGLNENKAITDNKEEKKPEIELASINNTEDDDVYNFFDSKSINNIENKTEIKVNKCDKKSY